MHAGLVLSPHAHASPRTVEYAGLLGRACPAAVYEYQDADSAHEDAEGKKFVINSQNCIHVGVPAWPWTASRADTRRQCKTCSIKTPTQDITWTVPEGGGGPKYSESGEIFDSTSLLKLGTHPRHHISLTSPPQLVHGHQH